MLNSLMDRLKKKRYSRINNRKVIPLILPIILIFSLLMYLNLSSVFAYAITVENTVDADSDIDATSNKGTDGSTDYTYAQSLDGSDQEIVESNEGGGAPPEGDPFISVYDSDIASGDAVPSITGTVDSGGDNAMAVVAVGYLDDESETATCTFDSVSMDQLLTAEYGGDDSRVYIWYLKNPNTGTSLDFVVTFSATLLWGVYAWGAVLNNVDLVDTFGDSEIFEGDPVDDVQFLLDAVVDDMAIGVIHSETMADTWESIGDGANVVEVTEAHSNAISILIGNSTGSIFDVNWDSIPTLDHTAAGASIIHSAGGASDDVSKYPSSIANSQDPADVGTYSDWTKMQAVDADENILTESQLGGGVTYPVLESWNTAEVVATTSNTVTKPSSTASGDLLILIVSIDGTGAPISIDSGGTSWNVMLAEVQNGGVTVATFYKIAGGSEPSSYVGRWTGNEDSVAGVLRFTNFDSGDPFDDSATSTGTADPVFPAITTTTDNTFILRLAGQDDDDDTEPIAGVPAGHSELWALATGGSSGETTQLACNTTKGDYGSVSSATWDQSGTSEAWYALTIAINGDVGVGSGDYLFDREFRFSSISTDNFTNVELDIKTGTMTSETLMMHIYDSGSWVFVANLTDSDDDTWINTSIIDYFATTMYFRFNSSIYDDTDSTENTWEIDAAVLHYWNTSTLYQLEWEHQVQSVDGDKTEYLLCVYGYSSSVTESFEIQMWNFGGSSWDTALTTEIDNTEQWYNQSISSGYIDGSDQITYRFRGTLEVSDITQDTLYIDWSGVRAYNFSVYGLPETFDSLNFSADNTYHAFDDSPLLFVVETGKIYDVQIKGTDITGTSIADGFIYYNTVDDTGSAIALTTSYVLFLNDQSKGNNSHNIYLWVNWGWVGGDAGVTDGGRSFSIDIQIINP